jgi:hypothetical protein
MRSSPVSLYLRVRSSEGGWLYARSVTASNGAFGHSTLSSMGYRFIAPRASTISDTAWVVNAFGSLSAVTLPWRRLRFSAGRWRYRQSIWGSPFLNQFSLVWPLPNLLLLL